MKLLFFFFLIPVYSLSQKTVSGDDFSKVFNDYSRKYKKVIVQVSTSERWYHYKIIFKKKNVWLLANHFVDQATYQGAPILKDSISINKCKDCSKVFEELLKKEDKLKSEKEIIEPCKKITRSIVRGDSAIKVEELHNIIDLGFETIEYRNKHTFKKISQLIPVVALKICPNSLERKIFLDLLNVIKNVQ